MIASIAAAALSLAIVTQDQAALRSGPKESSQQQAVLWQGDSLEIRGASMDYLQVYDHRRERAGFIRAEQVRKVSLEAVDAPSLLAVVRFVRDTPGAEALGISYAAAYLKAAPAEAIDAEPFDALGSMAERLADRGSSRASNQNSATLAAQLEVAASYGVLIKGIEQGTGGNARVRLCYDGEAFRRVMALKADARQRANAALALTRPECSDPSLGPTQRNTYDAWRADILDRVDLGGLPAYLKNRIKLRRASVWSSVAFERARKGEPAQQAATRALEELAGVNKSELAERDNAAYAEAGVRVGAVRWAVEPVPEVSAGLRIHTSAGNPGETCVSLLDDKHDMVQPLFKRCTYGVVWPASAKANRQGSALALAVQPLDGWREMWVFKKSGSEWQADVQPPSGDEPDIGYVEFAGWVPDGSKLLAAREVRIDGRFRRRFELLVTGTLVTERWADKPESLSLFYRWQDPAWKQQTVSLR
jgi:ADP-ribose pyrophosphatase YjhB (NUDIX family)